MAAYDDSRWVQLLESLGFEEEEEAAAQLLLASKDMGFRQGLLGSSKTKKTIGLIKQALRHAAALGSHGSSAPAYKHADECYQAFWKALDNVKITDKCLELPEGIFWFGTEAFGSVVVVRDCYGNFWKEIQVLCNTQGKARGVAVTGTPGIGKTLGLAGFILWLARAEGDASKRFSVLYHRINGSVFLYTFDASGTAVVYEAETVFALKAAMVGKPAMVGQPAYYYISDGAKPFESTGAPTILISAPDPEILKTFCQQHVLLYMDIWSLEELDALKKHYPDLPDDVYQQLLKWYGPVPRWCLEQSKMSLDPSRLRKAADDAITRKDLVAALCCYKATTADARRISHLLVHLRPSADMRDVVYKIATPYLAGKMMEAALEGKQAEFLTVMNSMARISGCTHVYGTLFEFYFLKLFVKGGEFDCKHYPGRPVVELPDSSCLKKDVLDCKGRSYKFTISTIKTIEFQDLSSVEESEFQTATLYFQSQLEGKSLAAADAILTPTEHGQPAFLIQVTAGQSKRPLSLAGVKAVQDFLGRGHKVWGESVLLVIMYVVPPETYGPFSADGTDDPAFLPDSPRKLPRLFLKFPVGMKDLCNTPYSSPDTSPGKRRKLEDFSEEELRAELRIRSAAVQTEGGVQ